jgi:hypothetical protein
MAKEIAEGARTLVGKEVITGLFPTEDSACVSLKLLGNIEARDADSHIVSCGLVSMTELKSRTLTRSGQKEE